MKALRLLAPLLLLPCVLLAAERTLKIDRSRSFVDVDVDATKNFTAHLDAYDAKVGVEDRKSTRLNSSHQIISYAVFCLKKKKDRPPRAAYIVLYTDSR